MRVETEHISYQKNKNTDDLKTIIARFFDLESGINFFLAKILKDQRLSFIAICCISYVSCLYKITF